MLDSNKIGINDSNIQAGINGNLSNNKIEIHNHYPNKKHWITAIGDQVEKLTGFMQGNRESVIQKFSNKAEYDKEKFEIALMNSDIFLRTLDESKFAGTEEMQEIRARILAQEYNHPNSISMRSWEEMKKMSATEFKYFEENIAPYVDGNLFISSRDFTSTIAHNMSVIQSNLFRYSYTRNIKELNEKNINNYTYYTCNNKNKLALSINAMGKITNNDMPTVNKTLTEFGVDLCKICEPRPWDLSVINETKLELEKLGLIYNTDFAFLDENNQNILQ
jgi:hypothetical protein